MKMRPLTFFAVRRIAQRASYGLGLLVLLLPAVVARVDAQAAAPIPPSSSVPAASAAPLKDFLGNYPLNPSFVIAITANGGELYAQATYQPRLTLERTSADNYAVAGVDAQVTFERDAAGKVVALVLHQNGQDLRAPRQASGPLPTLPKELPLTAEEAAEYIGHFGDSPYEFIVTQKAGQLFVKLAEQRAFKVFASAKDEFFYKVVNARITFERSPDGKIQGLVLHQNGQDLEAPKSDSAAADIPASPAPVVGPTYQYSSPIEPTIRNLAYADKSPAEKLDLYLPAPGKALAPLVIWVHGGGFMVGDKHSMPRRNFGPPPKPVGPMGPYQVQVPDVAALIARGYAVVSLNYRLGTSMYAAAIPAVQDGKAAVRFLRANAAKYHLDPGKFAVWGNSAGGYMGAMLGVTGDQPSAFDDPSLGNADVSSAVQAVVVWYGAEDRLPGEGLKIAHYLPTAKTFPAFRIVNGDADRIISSRQAQRLQAALIKAGANSTLTILPGAGHEDPAYMATQMDPTFAFLDRIFGR